MKKPIFFIFLLWIILCMFAGCVAPGLQHSTARSGGTIFLSANTVISISYDDNGIVTDISADLENGEELAKSFEELIGKDASLVVVDVVEKLNQSGYLAETERIDVSFAEQSDFPTPDFTEKIQESLSAAAKDNDWQIQVEISRPAESGTSASVQTLPSGVPDGAVLQENGTYAFFQYVNSSEQEVAQEKATYTKTTVYSQKGYVLSVELYYVQWDCLRKLQSYEYENDTLVSVTVQLFGKTGTFQSCYTDYYDPSGAVSKQVQHDEQGEITGSTEYKYFDNGDLQTEIHYFGDGSINTEIVYDPGNVILSKKTWLSTGGLAEELVYLSGILSEKTTYDKNGELSSYAAHWPNGNLKKTKHIGFFINGELIPGLCVSEYSEDGKCIHDVTYWPDGGISTEFYYYPSGYTKSAYSRNPSNPHNPEQFVEYKDGSLEPYSGWNMIDGEKVYFGAALQEQHPDWDYDDNGNLLRYTVTEKGYTYEVKKTYDSENRCITEEWLGEDGSRAYMEYGFGFNGWETLYSDRSGSLCQQEDAVRIVYDQRGGLHHTELYYENGDIMIDECSRSGKPYYLAYFYPDGRKEIYEYDEGELTYMYIECEDGSVIEQGKPRGN